MKNKLFNATYIELLITLLFPPIGLLLVIFSFNNPKKFKEIILFTIIGLIIYSFYFILINN